jgi:hypothetical protein
MFKIVRYRLFVIAAAVLVGALSHAGIAGAWGSTPGDATHHTILDFTQGNSLNVLVTNVQTTGSARSYPYSGSDTDPYAAINPTFYPTGTGFTPPTPDLYVKVLMDNSYIRSGSLSSANNYTCNQSSPNLCPSGSPAVPTTYVHRLGRYSSGSVTALTNTAISPGGAEILNNMFTKNGQAFDMDRIRFAANRLWAQWRSDVLGHTGWATMFSYQPTGTMSFENFVNNIVHGYPMFGIVRVVIPVETQSSGGWGHGGSRKTAGDMYLDPSQPVAGAEFSSSHSWSGTGTGSSSPVMVDYEAMWPGTSVPSTATSSSAREPYSGTVTVYGMLLIDYVDSRTYDPDHFFDSTQDYIDNYTDVATHDAASLTGRSNVILPRSSGRNVVLMDWDTLNINPIDDLQSFVEYTDTHNPGPDGRMDTLDIARRKYVMGNLIPSNSSTTAAEISDDYVWEYWMRKAMALPVGNSTRTSIISDLTGSAPQFNVWTQKFNTGAARRTVFNSTEWPAMAEQDRFHAYFPSGYERGWMIAFDALRMDQLDQTTASKGVGSWWAQLTQDATGTDGVMTSKNYAPFEVPSDNQALTVDANGDGTAVTMPNFFSTDWEDLPAMAFAGGLFDVHGFMNTSGMLYTPDSCEIEAHSGSELPGGSNSAGPFQYVNGALLVGNGLWLEDQNTGDHSMIAISYNFNSFDKLRTGTARLTVKQATNIAELKGQ